MDNFRRGFDFLKQSWRMALADHDLIKPSIYAILVGFGVALITLIPMALAGFFLSDLAIGRGIIYALSAVIIFAQFVVTYIFSAMTVYLVYGYLAEGDGRMDRAFKIVQRDFLDILSLAAASTVVTLIRNFLSSGKRGQRGGKVAAGIIDTVWTEATFLVLPIMVIEDVNLKEGLRRATYLVKNNLLLVGISTVGVKLVTGLIGFLLTATGIALGLGVGLGIISISGGAGFGLVGGISLGVLLAMPFILAATVLSSYTATAYHTCLYLWARDVERAREGGQIGQVQAPAPLAAVLSANPAAVSSMM